MSATRPVLIAGGGIGGLALALALSQAGRPSIVLERRTTPGTEGAGIQLGPNGVHVLRRLGLADALRPRVGEPDGIEVRDGRSARLITRLPLGDWLAARHGAPYWAVHRGDLHRVLHDAATAADNIELRMDRELQAAAQDEGGVLATCVGGETIAGSALIGADGLWSSVRRCVAPKATPTFVGATATRAVIAAADAGSLPRSAVGLWLTPGVHVVHYPVRAGREIAVVVIAAEDWHGTQWDAEADAASLRTRLSGFHASLAGPLSGIAHWRKWALHRLEPLPRWTDGAIALLGDAAHPMLPYLAQGGVMALEDALVLARCLARTGDVTSALLDYQRQRLPRATRVQALSQRNGRIYHLQPPLAWARNATLGLLPATRVMAGLDWLYGWQLPSP